MALALSPDGTRILSSYLDAPNQPVILWDVAAHEEVSRFGIPGNPWFADQELQIASAAFSPDGKTARFGTAFGSGLWWDIDQWRQITHNVMFDEELEHVWFSPDGSGAIAAGCDVDAVEEDAKIRFWKLP